MVRRTDEAFFELADEPSLVARAADGDTAACDEIHRRHAPSVWGLALAVTGDADEATIAVGEAFARVFTSVRLGRVTSDLQLRDALLTSGRNAAVDVVRSRNRPGNEVVPLDGPDRVPADRYTEGTPTARRAEAFFSLPERWRSMLWVTEVEDLDVGSAAAVVALAPEAAGQVLLRARQGLRQRLLHVEVASAEALDCRRATTRLASFALGSLSSSDTDRVSTHLSGCAACTARLADLDDVDRRLGVLALPVPDDLLERSRRAWAAVISTQPLRGAGQSERAFATVSLATAALGVLGAALFGLRTPGLDQPLERHRTVTPAAVDSILEDPLASGIGVPTDATNGSTDGSAGSGRGRTNIGEAFGGAVDGPSTTGPKAPAPTGPDGSAPTPPVPGGPVEPPATDPDGSHVDLPDLPGPDEGLLEVAVGVTVGDAPLAVEIGVGGGPTGATVGPLTIESAPKPGDSPVTVGGSLVGGSAPTSAGPITEIVATVVEPVTNLLGG